MSRRNLFISASFQRRLAAIALLSASVSVVWGQTGTAGQMIQTNLPGRASAPTVTMSFEFANPALTPAAYRLDFDANGIGHYHSESGASQPEFSGSGSSDRATAIEAAEPGAPALPLDRQIEIGAPLREQLLAAAHSPHMKSGECESRQHKVAFTGTKTIRYTGPDGHAGCTFNWSQDAQIMKAAEAFMAVAFTLEAGQRLHSFYLHDRLSLDEELQTLMTAVRNGSALEVENIAPELQAIASDSAVMKRAQARAAALLAGAPPVAETAALHAR